MNEELERAIKVLLSRIVQTVQPDQALKLSQAALNMAQVKQLVEQTTKKRAGAS